MLNKTTDNILQVAILTYNHKDFIEKCINSILSQKTTFNFGIVIFDDCSNDGTTEILKRIKNNHDERISIFINETNQGPYKSALKLAKHVTSKYQTWLDGDDYWCYNKKLQTQIDFLEANSEYSGCFHDARIELLTERIKNYISIITETLCDNEYRIIECFQVNRKIQFFRGILHLGMSWKVCGL